MVEPHTDWVTSSPSPLLAPYIERYVGYRLTGFDPGVHRGLPSRLTTFIVSIGPTIDVVAQTDETQSPQSYRTVLSGLQATSALISHDGNQEGVAIELSPLGFRSLFAMPARALWNTSVELHDVIGSLADELGERLDAVASWPGRFAECDRVLARLVSDDAPARELAHAWSLIVRSGGEVSVSEVADTLGWSRQHLARRFGDEFGLGPKLAARVVRFERARQMLQDAPSFVTIAQVAATCGYYDQAHLNRDFAELAGCSPTTWLREELPSFQDGAAEHLSGSDT